ncbi:MAG TPA: glycosyltransferase family 39 protein [Anaerolineae bacterium]|nr:glycosyltransferase family 39 protein [Anaerolineae bacterium]
MKPTILASAIRQKDWQLILALIGVSLILNLIGITWGLPYPPGVNPGDAAWALDAIDPVKPLAAAREGFSWGTWSSHEFTYPLAHYILLALVFAPYVAYLALSGGLTGGGAADYPYGLADPVTALSTLALLARLVSVLMATGIVVLTFLIVRALFERRAAFFAALMVAVCYPLVFYAHVTTLDVPYIFWVMLALYAYTQVMIVGQRRHYVGLGIFAAMALATKDQAYALLIALPLPLIWFHLRRWQAAPRTVASAGWLSLGRDLSLGAGGFAVTYAVANNLLSNFPRFVLHSQALIERRVFDRVLDPTTLDGHLRLFLQTLSYLGRSLNWPLFALCLIGLVYCLYRYRSRTAPYLAPLVSYYGLFIVGSAFYVHSRHVIPLAILLAFFGGKLLSDLTANRQLPHRLRYAGVGIVFAYSLAYSFSQDLTLLNDPRLQAGEWLEANAPAGAVIEVYSTSTYLPHFSTMHRVEKRDFAKDGKAEALQARRPDYIVVTEHEYRPSADHDESEALERALRDNPYLEGLCSGRFDYELLVSFKYKLHDVFYADMIYGQNPRIMIFRHKVDQAAQRIEASLAPAQ